ncbi:MAG: RNA 2'-phosphotransferase [Actinomycetota bacterium]|nr:RNA 2'-phosphotransferase [Actinomycetota bacterium]
MSASEAYVKESRFLALVLRHKPEEAGIVLDEHGWADVDDLIAGMSTRHPFSRVMLEEIVATDSKGRYSFNEDRSLIRANQGHSVDVDVELEEKEPPGTLFHGTAKKYLDSIMEQGLIPKSRLYVHLSADEETAIKVGRRHGSPAVLTIDASTMHNAGIKFYLSKNGVWLTKHVPPQYLNLLDKQES